MFELDFKTFMDIADTGRKQHNDRYRKLHYEDNPTNITLYIRSQDYWEYFTVVLKSKMLDMYAGAGITEATAVRMFKTNILYDAIPIKKPEVEVEDLPREISDDDGNTEFDPGVLTKNVTLDIGKEEAKDYADFLLKKFTSWEKQILSFVDSELSEEVSKSYLTANKSLGDFLRRTLNIVNTSSFLGEIKRIIKFNMSEGIDDAEEELGMDIGFKIEFDQELNANVQRQMDGFWVGKKRWPGLKGVTKELEDNIRNAVLEGVTDRKSTSWIKESIKTEFNKYTGTTLKEGRAMMIARTESNRFRNNAKLSAFRESGLDGFKVWDARMDDRTSPICQSLNGQKVGLSENFVDPKTGEEFIAPPAHPNCRSIIRFVLDE
tara:strand:- start:145 stop:1275 length:1131 start_codon:yes stop_codon:yes gene_type:complete